MASQAHDKYTPPKTTAGDAAQIITRAALSAIPVVGGPAAELVSAVVGPLVDNRREWMESVADAIRRLEAQSAGHIHETQGRIARFGSDHYLIAAYLQTHLRRQLMSVDPRGPASLIVPVRNLRNNRSVVTRLPKRFDVDAVFSSKLLRSEQLGLLNERMRSVLSDAQPLDIAVPHSMTATVAILVYMRDVLKLPIRIIYMTHTPDIVAGIASDRSTPDFCVVTDATFIALQRARASHNYAFCTFLPSTELRILTPSGAQGRRAGQNIRRGRYGLLLDALSTPLFLLEQMCNNNGKTKWNVTAEHHEPHEFVGLLQSGDPDLRLIIWDAHWCLYEQKNLCRVHPAPRGCTSRVECMLFSRDDVPSAVTQAVVVALRHSWAHLFMERQRQLAIVMMLRDDHFVKGLTQACGLR